MSENGVIYNLNYLCVRTRPEKSMHITEFGCMRARYFSKISLVIVAKYIFNIQAKINSFLIAFDKFQTRNKSIRLHTTL